ncbi:MAG: thiamine-phosphate kinase [Sneathiella sp.]|nr:thiamine-phosphate kinase [Sneathiella sp.]
MTVNNDRIGEFDVIEDIFSPLSINAPGAFGLTDDAAVMSVASGLEMVITKDAMVAGVHFLENDSPENIAKKLLRTNLSDLAAMGAKPVSYLLATAWPDTCDVAWIRRFANGLSEDQKKYNVSLIGGDTVKTSGPLTLSLTLLGTVETGKSLRRNGAKAGDLVCVSGTIGDAALGLLVALQKLAISDDSEKKFLLGRYFVPDPRVLLGSALTGIASSCIDISDGLLADIGHICRQSNLGAVIERSKIPLSPATQNVILKDPALGERILSGGDDYELAFTVSKERYSEIVRKAKILNINISVIGEMVCETGVSVLDEAGLKISTTSNGWAHF